MIVRVKFTQMKDGDKEDYDFLTSPEIAKNTPNLNLFTLFGKNSNSSPLFSFPFRVLSLFA
jgi:hypothetical protein